MISLSLSRNCAKFFALFLLLAPLSAQAAASWSMTTSAIEVQPGGTFTVSVAYAPEVSMPDTVRFRLGYANSIVKAERVTLSGAWDQTSPGSVINHEAGNVYWGGFTFDTPGTRPSGVATITFRALVNGVATLSLTEGAAYTDGRKLGGNLGGGVEVHVGGAPVVEPIQELPPDTTPPADLAVEPSETAVMEGEKVEIDFGATDESGDVDYSVSINGGEYQPAESPLVLNTESPGDVLVAVKAEDAAGNTAYDSTTVRVYPLGTFLENVSGKIEAAWLARDWAKLALLLAPILLLLCGTICLIKRRHKKHLRLME